MIAVPRWMLALAVLAVAPSIPAEALTPAEQIEAGRHLFMEETFGGNGRTCATCHVASLNFRLTPANVAQRFATLAQTFDPLFIAEAEAESNMNLNTLTVDAAVGFPNRRDSLAANEWSRQSTVDRGGSNGWAAVEPRSATAARAAGFTPDARAGVQGGAP